MEKRGTGQKVAFTSAIIFYICSVVCMIALGYWGNQLGGNHPITASLGASVVFFIAAGIVLHVIGRADLPNLSMASLKEKPPES